ncbi:CDGSH iron-sulfur domain-containing protein [Halosquirtibacter xylanolyticus]|uniref:CDGSH iron-sulfur domain-containing protein n=1 Tax=Halosquirtibacter xylanolyticus TaxID=3374599 RepID=UPI003748DDEB|nr:CDGSH iron-sulfur domain-containing protein [Prolixibacteraceae bacterium]
MKKKNGQIVVSKYSPLMAVDIELFTQDGEILPMPRVFSLCRCGASKKKPFCDGTHASIHFSGERAPNKELDKAPHEYKGDKMSVFDKRALCCHHGTCNLEEVFTHEKPWIRPENAERVEDVVEVVMKCPTGALTAKVGDEEFKEWFDVQKVIVRKDGPYYVQGGIKLIDDQWTNLVLVTEDHYALCRCGASKIKPLCDGTHASIGFKD